MGYESGALSAHQGIFSSTGLTSRKTRPWLHTTFQSGIFIDVSYGVDNITKELLSADQASGGFVGARLVGELLTAQALSLKTQIALPISVSGDALEYLEEEDSPIVYFTLGLQL